MAISIIAAMAENRAIGFKGQIPWRLPADFKWFKDHTMGHPVIMGSKTFESMGKPLPGRTNIVLTKNPDYRAGTGAGGASEGAPVLIAHTIEDSIALAKTAPGSDEIFICGGGQVYALALPLVDTIYLTRVHGTFEGDAFFPEFDESTAGPWELVATEPHQRDEKNPLDFDFLTYRRKK